MNEQNLLFTPMEINGMPLKNRLVKSATYEHMATEDGKATDQLINFYSKLSKGLVGLIVVGATYVQDNGHGLPCQIGISNDDHIPGLKQLNAGIWADRGEIEFGSIRRQGFDGPAFFMKIAIHQYSIFLAKHVF